jgi:TRAP transporter TAXI family solute receptor
MKRGLSFIVIFMMLTGISFISKAQLTIATGFEKGSYYVMANDMKGVSSNPDQIKILTTTGSISNFNKLTRDSTVDVGFMQFDVLVYEELSDVKKKSKITDKVKIVLPLGYEQIHLLTLKEYKYKKLSDLKEKTVAIGAKTMGSNYTAKLIKKLTEGEWDESEMSFDDALAALLDKRIDALFFVGAAPINKFISPSPAFNKLALIPITDKKLAEYYTTTVLKKGTYAWQDKDVNTYAVKMVLTVDISKLSPTDESLLNQFINDVKGNLSKLQDKGHPAWKTIDFNFSDVKWKIYEGSKTIFGVTDPQ